MTDHQDRTDNYSVLTTREWQVHCYGDAPPPLQSICTAHGLKLHVFPWNAQAREAGLVRNAAYIVRPDGHIGIIDRIGNPGAITDYLKRWTISLCSAIA